VPEKCPNWCIITWQIVFFSGWSRQDRKEVPSGAFVGIRIFPGISPSDNPAVTGSGIRDLPLLRSAPGLTFRQGTFSVGECLPRGRPDPPDRRFTLPKRQYCFRICSFWPLFYRNKHKLTPENRKCQGGFPSLSLQNRYQGVEIERNPCFRDRPYVGEI
jgi:hypothetical protein